MLFISYATEDVEYIHGLYTELKAVALNPWMDKPPPPDQYKGIPIGARWEVILEDRIRRADQIVLALSSSSIAKRGYVTKEFRLALDLMNNLPQDSTLVYPIRIDKCEVPSLRVGQIDLRELQWWDVPPADRAEFATALSEQLRG
ncbi:toll/interleukin-1 receptor domain-containing protein [Paracoccus yeei]|uniref:toll/interleukin-1 receptor domain-containing protein n=1 Tax=Paracoccus yeei TaxID=147645 RepID=UPI003BF82B90